MGDQDLKDYYGRLLSASQVVLEEASVDAELLGKANQTIDDFKVWLEILTPRPEAVVLGHALTESSIALYSLVSGLYRPAFGSLRLFLELALGAIHFSVNRLELAEWLGGNYDIKWATLSDPDGGVLSHCFAKAFFPELDGHVTRYARMASVLYRELSEFVHGNHHTWGLTQDRIFFNKGLHEMWFKEFDTAALIVSFCMCLRFLRELDTTMLPKVEDSVLGHLGHIDPIRDTFGGPSES